MALQGYWKLDDTTDESANGYDLTNNNSATFTTGQYGDAVSVTRASSQYLSIADGSCPNLEIADDKTYMCWYKASVLTNWNVIMGKFVGGTGGARIYHGSTGVINVDFGLSASVWTDTGIGTGTWYFIAARYDKTAGTLAVWLDDTKKTASSVTGSTVDSNTAFIIGAQADPTHYCDALIDEVRVYDEALTDTQIDNLRLYNDADPTAVQDVLGSGIIPFNR